MDFFYFYEINGIIWELNKQHNKTNNISPTYMPKTETLRACDIIIPSSQGRCVAICYK